MVTTSNSDVHQSQAAETNLVTINPVANLPLKLTTLNFPSWRSQVETLLMGLDLLGYLDGTSVAPARTITKEEFIRWFRQDKLLLHAIRCYVSENIYPYVTTAESTHEAWTILEKLYASRSRSRIMNLKDRLAKEKQGDRDVSTYIHAMKSLAAELSLVQAPVSDDDLVVHCLRGLNPEYHQFSAVIRARGITTTIEDLLDILVDYEADLKHQTPPPEPPVPTVYYTHQQRGRFSGRGVRSSHIRSGGNTFNRGGGTFGNPKRGAATHHRHFAAGRNIIHLQLTKLSMGRRPIMF
ncbi:Retrovirus-related Pol polyprotein from transposon RE1 [Linum perenne]